MKSLQAVMSAADVGAGDEKTVITYGMGYENGAMERPREGLDAGRASLKQGLGNEGGSKGEMGVRASTEWRRRQYHAIGGGGGVKEGKGWTVEKGVRMVAWATEQDMVWTHLGCLGS